MTTLTIDRPKKQHQTRLERNLTDDGDEKIRCASKFKSIKCTIAEVAWIQRSIGGPVGPWDWATELHEGKAPKTWERSWERFKANLIKWEVPHEKIPVVQARVHALGTTQAMFILLKIAPEDVDEWFWRMWNVPEPGHEYLFTIWSREQRLKRKLAEERKRWEVQRVLQVLTQIEKKRSPGA